VVKERQKVDTSKNVVLLDHIKGLLFDLDGTLIDTDDVMGEGLARKLEPLAGLFPNRDPQPFARRLLVALENPLNYVALLMERFGLSRVMMLVADRLRRLKGLGTTGRNRLVPGAEEAIRGLAGTYRLGVVTTRTRADAEAFLHQHGLCGLFEAITTRSDVWRLKPHPSPVQRSVSMLGLSPGECCFVGDTELDVLAGKRAGVYSVGVLSGFGLREELERAGADLILPSVAEIPPLLS